MDQPLNDRFQRVLLFLASFWVLALILGLYPYTADPANPIKYLLTYLAAALLTGTLLVGVLFGKMRLRCAWPLITLIAFFLLINGLAALSSAFPANSLHLYRHYLLLALIALLCAQIFQRESDLWRLFGAVVSAMSLAALYGWIQRLGWDPFPWAQQNIEEYRGLPATFANPNFAGHALVISLPMAAALLAAACLKPEKRRWILPALFALLLLLSHLFATHMRGARIALLAMLALTLLTLILRLPRLKPSRLAKTVLLLSLSVILLLGVIGILSTREGKAPFSIDASAALRLNGYHGAARIFLDHPLLGVGPGNYERVNIPYWTDHEARWFATAHKRNFHVHCDSLECLAESGFLGGVAYFALILFGLYTALSLAGQGKNPLQALLGMALAAALCGFAVDGLFGFPLRVPVSAGLFFLCLGAAAGLHQAQSDRPFLSKRFSMIALPLLFGFSLLILFYEFQSFQAERFRHAATGAEYHAARFRQAGDAKRADNLLENACALLDKGEKLAPADPRFNYQKGAIRLDQGRFSEATESLLRALKKNPTHPETLISLAQSYLNQALGLSQAQTRTPEEEAELAKLLDHAAKTAQRAIELCPYLADGHEALGRLLFMQTALEEKTRKVEAERWLQVAAHFQKALAHGSANRALILRMQAQALHNAQQGVEALAAIRQSVHITPTEGASWRLFRLLADHYQAQEALLDSLSAALPDLRNSDPAPKQVIALLTGYLAELYLTYAKNPDLARETLLQGLALVPEPLNLWASLCSLSPPEQRFEALTTALRASEAPLPPLLQKVADLQEGQGAAFQSIAEELVTLCRQASGRYDIAYIARNYAWLAEVLEEQIRQEPIPKESLGATLAALGECLILIEKWPYASRVLNQALKHLPPEKSTQALMLLSQAQAALGAHAQALDLARKALEQAPGSKSLRWNLAKRLGESGHLAEARFEYETLLRETRTGTAAHRQLLAESQALHP